MKYYELVIGDPRNRRGLLLTENQLQDKIKEFFNSKTEYYTSVFYFDEEIIKYYQLNNKLKGYNGNLGIDELIFDIDIENNTDEEVLNRARKFVMYLMNNWDLKSKEIDIWYSGRGYHVYINDYFKFGFGKIVDTVKNTIKEHFPLTDLSIYKYTGLIRGKYSYNKRSDRYKIPLEHDEFFKLSVNEIIELSKNPNKEFESIREEFDKDFSKHKIYSNVDLNFSIVDEPTRIVTCMQKLYVRGQKIGRRNIEILRLASAFRRQGLHIKATIDLLTKWADTLESSKVIDTVKRVYEVGYRYGCNDYIMSEFCDPKCIFFTHKNYDNKVVSGYDALNEVNSYLEFIKNSKYISLTKTLDLDVEINLYPGEYTVIFGDTKLGKSTIVNNIVLNNLHLKWLLLPLENGIPLEIKRLVQIENNCSEDKAIELIKSNSEAIDFIHKLNFYDKALTIEDLRKFIIESDAEAIIIDTVDQIVTKKDDYVSKTELLANEIRELANSLKRIFIIVHHISKNAVIDATNKSKPLTIHSGKGSSAIEQKANYVISIEGDRNSSYRLIKAQGGRDKALFEITTEYNPITKQIKRIKL